MRVQTGQLISLGYGKYVRSDDVVAVEPITDGRGPRHRSRVWLRGIPDPLVASRSEGAIVDDLVTPLEEAARMRQQRSVLQQVVRSMETVPAVFRRVIKEQNGVDLDLLAEEARRVLG